MLPQIMQSTDRAVFEPSNIRVTRDGYLTATPRIARTGIQFYSGEEMGVPHKQVVRVNRPETTVFAPDAMRSLAHKPITLDHPPDPVTSRNWKQVAVGHVGDEVVRDGNFIRVPLVLQDEEAIKQVQTGKAELS